MYRVEHKTNFMIRHDCVRKNVVWGCICVCSMMCAEERFVAVITHGMNMCIPVQSALAFRRFFMHKEATSLHAIVKYPLDGQVFMHSKARSSRKPCTNVCV
jgi:hypothetical protein